MVKGREKERRGGVPGRKGGKKERKEEKEREACHLRNYVVMSKLLYDTKNDAIFISTDNNFISSPRTFQLLC